MPPAPNGRLAAARRAAAPAAKASRATAPADDDDPRDNDMLASITDLMATDDRNVIAAAPAASGAASASEVIINEFVTLERDYSFLSTTFSGSVSTPTTRSTSEVGGDFDSNAGDSDLFAPPPEVIQNLRAMSKDALLAYAAKVTAVLGGFVARERHRQLLNQHLGGSARDSATPPCISPGNMSFSHSIRSLRLPPVVHTNNVAFSEDSEGNETINEYSIIAEIGRGAYGYVVLAVSNKTEETFAIKVMKKNMLKRGSDEAIVKREIAVMRKLRHQNIVPLFEVLDDPAGDKMYMVMKYIDSGPLLHVRDDLTCNPLNPDVAAKYLRQLVSGLQYLHNHGVIHRDLKPDNIMLDRQGTVYLTDFGVSDIVESPHGSVQGLEGTPVFLAPELLSETKSRFKGAPVDVWALGITFYMAIFGRAPFMGKTWRDISKKVTEDTPTYPATAPPDWIDVLSRLLEKDPKKRITLKQLKRHALFAGLAPVASGNELEETMGPSNDSMMADSTATKEMSVTDDEVNAAMTHVGAPIMRTLSISDTGKRRVKECVENIRALQTEKHLTSIGQIVEEVEIELDEPGDASPPNRAIFASRDRAANQRGPKPPSAQDASANPRSRQLQRRGVPELDVPLMASLTSAADASNMASTSRASAAPASRGTAGAPRLPAINSARINTRRR